jgi:hypothetical protein
MCECHTRSHCMGHAHQTEVHHLCRTGYCKAEIKDLAVKDLTASLCISKQLPKGTMLSKLKDSAWRKESILLVNVIRGARRHAAYVPADTEPHARLHVTSIIMLLAKQQLLGHAMPVEAAATAIHVGAAPSQQLCSWLVGRECLEACCHVQCLQQELCSKASEVFGGSRQKTHAAVQGGLRQRKLCTHTSTSSCTPYWSSWMER